VVYVPQALSGQHHRPEHAGIRAPQTGLLEAHVGFCAAGAGRLEHVLSVARPARRRGQ
jgi:hypothetical protein